MRPKQSWKCQFISSMLYRMYSHVVQPLSRGSESSKNLFVSRTSKVRAPVLSFTGQLLLSLLLTSVCVVDSSVQQLALLGQSLGVRMPPMYDQQWSNDGRCRATVVFSNMTFTGSLARTYEQAVDSAASVALFNLVSLLTVIRNILISCLVFYGNIIRTALCWTMWHNVHSPQHTYMSSFYRSDRLALSHWDPYSMNMINMILYTLFILCDSCLMLDYVRVINFRIIITILINRGGCLQLYYCNMVEWLVTATQYSGKYITHTCSLVVDYL